MAVENSDEQQPFVADQGRSPYKVIMAGIKGVGKSTLLAMLDSKVDVGFGEGILFSIRKGESSRGRTKLMLETKCQDKILSVSSYSISTCTHTIVRRTPTRYQG